MAGHRTLLIGDVVVPHDIELLIGAVSVQIGKGSWFATPAEFFASAGVTATTLTTGAVAISGGGTGSLFVEGEEFAKSLGLEGETTTYTGSLAVDAAPTTMAVSLGISKYNRSLSSDDGSTCFAVDGTQYSTRGNVREDVDFAMALARETPDDRDAWERIWKLRWAKGRSVAVIIDRGDDTEVYDSLVMAEEKASGYTRIVEGAYKVAETVSLALQLRNPIPQTQVGQRSLILPWQ